ncbi:hypothetical protein L9F63_004061, partial [Diploptera punctata]
MPDTLENLRHRIVVAVNLITRNQLVCVWQEMSHRFAAAADPAGGGEPVDAHGILIPFAVLHPLAPPVAPPGAPPPEPQIPPQNHQQPAAAAIAEEDEAEGQVEDPAAIAEEDEAEGQVEDHEDLAPGALALPGQSGLKTVQDHEPASVETDAAVPGPSGLQ